MNQSCAQDHWTRVQIYEYMVWMGRSCDCHYFLMSHQRENILILSGIFAFRTHASVRLKKWTKEDERRQRNVRMRNWFMQIALQHNKSLRRKKKQIDALWIKCQSSSPPSELCKCIYAVGRCRYLLYYFFVGERFFIGWFLQRLQFKFFYKQMPALMTMNSADLNAKIGFIHAIASRAQIEKKDDNAIDWYV